MEDTLLKQKETLYKPQSSDAPAGLAATLIKSPAIEQSIARTAGAEQRTLLKSPGETGGQQILLKGPVSPDVNREITEAEIIEGIYRVEREIGQGAMGTVYLVHHLLWDLDLAVKTIRVDRLSRTMLQMFLSEAEIWIELAKHPHITTAFYIRDLKDMPAIFVEYADGGSLTQWLRQGRDITLEDKLEKAIQFCEGMAYAHSKKLIHRDIKPENVLLLKDGTVKITDFGLARSLTPAVETGANGGDEMDCCGTPPYMPPEQWSAASAAKEPADIYSFGVLFYEMMAGCRPFVLDADDPRSPEIAYRLKHLTEKPESLLTHVPGLPRDLDRLVMKCLEKEPAGRFSSFIEVGDLLKGIYKTITGKEYEGIPFDVEKTRADDLNNRALSFLDLKREDRAEALWKQALAIDNYHFSSNINLALLYWNRDFIGQAATIDRLLNNAVEADKKTGYYYKGMMELLSGDHDQALDTADLALFKGYGGVDMYNLKGLALLGGKFLKTAPPTKRLKGGRKEQYSYHTRVKESEAAFHTALELAPDHPGITGNLGHALWAADRQDEARQCWDRARQGGIKATSAAPGLWDIHRAAGLTQKTWGENPLYIHPPDNCLYVREGQYSNSFELGIYDLKTGKRLRTMKGDNIRAIIPNKKRASQFIVSVSETLNLKDTREGKIVVRLGSLGEVYRKKLIGTIDKRRAQQIKINAVGISPDYSIALGSRANGTMDVWDLDNPKILATLEGNEYKAALITFLHANRVLLGGWDGCLRILDFENPRQTEGYKISFTLEGHQKALLCLAFSPDRKLAVSGSADHTIRIWDLETRQCLQVLEGHTDAVKAVAFAGNENTIVSVSFDRTVKVWIKEDSRFRLVKSFRAFREGITMTMAALSPDGRFALLGSSKSGQMNRQGYYDQINIWELKSSDTRQSPIYYRPIDPIFTRVSTVSDDIGFEEQLTVLIRDAETMFKEGRFHLCYEKVLEARNIPGCERNPQLLDLLNRLVQKGARKSLEGVYLSGTCEVKWQNILEITPYGSKLVTLDQPRNQQEKKPYSIVIRELDGSAAPKKLTHESFITAAAADPLGGLISADNLGTLYSWDIQQRRCLKKIKLEKYQTNRIIISPNNQTAILSSNTNGLKVLDLKDFSLSWEMWNQDEVLSDATFSPDGRFFAFYRSKREKDDQDKIYVTTEVQVRDCRTMELLLSIPGVGRFFYLTPGFKLWVMRYRPDSLEQWDLMRLEKISSINVILQWASLFTMIPLRQMAIFVGRGSIRLWDTHEGKQLHVLNYGQEDFSYLHVSPDGRFLAAGNRKGFLTIVNLLTGKSQKDIRPGFPIALTGNWKTIAAGQKDNSIQLYETGWQLYFPGMQPEWMELEKEFESQPSAAVSAAARDLEQTLLKKPPAASVRDHLLGALGEKKNGDLEKAEQSLLHAWEELEKIPPNEVGELAVITADFLAGLRRRKEHEYCRTTAVELIAKADNLGQMDMPALVRLEQAMYMVGTGLDRKKDSQLVRQLEQRRTALLGAIMAAGENLHRLDGEQDPHQAANRCIYILKTAAEDPSGAARQKTMPIAFSILKKLYQAFAKLVEESKQNPDTLEEAEEYVKKVDQIARLSGNPQLIQKAKEIRHNLHDWYHYHGSKFLNASELSRGITFFEKALDIAGNLGTTELEYKNLDRLAKCYCRQGNIMKVRDIEAKIGKLNINNHFVHHERHVKGTILNTYLQKVRDYLDNPGSASQLHNLNSYLDTAARLAGELGDHQKAGLVEPLRKKVAAAVFHKHLEEVNEKMNSTDSKAVNHARIVLDTAMKLAERSQLPLLAEKARQLKIVADENLLRIKKISDLNQTIAFVQNKLDFQVSQLEKMKKISPPPGPRSARFSQSVDRQAQLYQTLDRKLNQALEWARELNDNAACCSVYSFFAHVNVLSGSFIEAARYTEKAVALAQQLNKPGMIEKVRGVWITEGKRILSHAEANLEAALQHLHVQANATFYLAEAQKHLTRARELEKHTGPGELRILLRKVSEISAALRYVIEAPGQMEKGQFKQVEARLLDIRQKMDSRRFPQMALRVDSLLEEVRKKKKTRGFFGNLWEK